MNLAQTLEFAIFFTFFARNNTIYCFFSGRSFLRCCFPGNWKSKGSTKNVYERAQDVLGGPWADVRVFCTGETPERTGLKPFPFFSNDCMGSAEKGQLCILVLFLAMLLAPKTVDRELKNIYHQHPERKRRRSSEGSSGSLHPYGRRGNVGKKTRKSLSTIAMLGPVKAIFEKSAATVEVDTFISLVRYRPKGVLPQRCSAHFWRRI